MSKNIQVLLLEHVPGLGRAGDIITAAEGYARNSLFPDGKAVLANVKVRSRQAVEKARDAVKAEAALEVLQEKATVLDNSEITFTARVKEGDQIYGSISKKQVVAELNQKAQLSVGEKDVTIKTPLKRLGSYDMTVALSPDIECKIKVTVVPIHSPTNQTKHEE